MTSGSPCSTGITDGERVQRVMQHVASYAGQERLRVVAGDPRTRRGAARALRKRIEFDACHSGGLFGDDETMRAIESYDWMALATELRQQDAPYRRERHAEEAARKIRDKASEKAGRVRVMGEREAQRRRERTMRLSFRERVASGLREWWALPAGKRIGIALRLPVIGTAAVAIACVLLGVMACGVVTVVGTLQSDWPWWGKVLGVWFGVAVFLAPLAMWDDR